MHTASAVLSERVFMLVLNFYMNKLSQIPIRKRNKSVEKPARIIYAVR